MSQTPDITTEISLGDIVRLAKPYRAARDERGTFTHGIVCEIVARGGRPGSPSENVSLYLFNPRSGRIYSHSEAPYEGTIPQHVDMATHELTLVHKASEGYLDHDSETSLSDLLPDEVGMWQQVRPLVETLSDAGVVTDFRFFMPNIGAPRATISVADGTETEKEYLMETAERVGWEVSTRDMGKEETLTLRSPQHEAALEA